MVRALNGLHWQINPGPAGDTAINVGAGFGSVLYVADAGQGAKDYIWWLKQNMKCQVADIADRIIVRLYYPRNQTLPSASDLASKWADLVRWCQSIGVHKFVVLNELDLEYPNQLWNPATQSPMTPSYMAELAKQLRQRANPGQTLHLGFPGPSAQTAAGSTGWNNYWNGFKDVINQHYDHIALHAYGHSVDQLKNDTRSQATYVRNLFPTKGVRFTEYGIPIGDFGNNRTNRAKAYAEYVTWVRANFNYIRSVFVFISRTTSEFPEYELTNEEAKVLVDNVGGCVGL